MKSAFPTIWYRGHEAGFYVGEHLVRVPLKFGLNDKATHAVPWLRRMWPFTVRHGRLVKRYTQQVNGDRREVEIDLLKLWAEAAHRDIGFEWSRVTAKDGDFKHWTITNVVPVRDPNAPATDAEKEHEAQRQMRAHQFDGSFPFLMKFFAKFLRTQSNILTTEQLTQIQTASVQTLLTAERLYAADLTRDDVEQQNFAERKVSNMTRPDLVIEPRPENHPDGVVHTRPKTPTKTIGWFDENGESDHTPMLQGRKQVSASNMEQHGTAIIQAARDKEQAQHKIRGVRLDNDGRSRDEHRAELQGHWNDPSTERVLNIHGWFTPANGHHPTYEGKCGELG